MMIIREYLILAEAYDILCVGKNVTVSPYGQQKSHEVATRGSFYSVFGKVV